MCVGMCVDMWVGMWVGMWVDMWVGMWVGMRLRTQSLGSYGHVLRRMGSYGLMKLWPYIVMALYSYGLI